MFAHMAYAWEVNAEVPSRKVRDAMQKEGWQFGEGPSLGTLINHPTLFNAAKGERPLEIVPTETIVSIYMSGTDAQIELYKAEKKRAAAKTYGIA